MPTPALITCGIYLHDSLSNKFLICHATNASWKTWSIPKGLKENAEDSLAAASRELKEETGIDLKKINIITKVALPPVKYKKQNKILESFYIRTDSELVKRKLRCSTYTPKGEPEIDKWAWIDLEQLPSKVHESQGENFVQLLQLTKNE